MRKCKKCGREKSLDDFPVAGIIDGKVYKRWKCNVCYVKMKTARKNGITCWLENIKKELKCSRCGNDDFRVLEFHHGDDNKDFNISEAAARGYGRDRLRNEINKCDTLCANCHRILHYEERHNGLECV